MSDRIAVLHLRSCSGSGGGAEKVILKSGQLIDKNRFLYLIVYLKKKKGNLSFISQKAKKANPNYYEFSGIRFIDFEQLWDIFKLIKRYKVQILHCNDPKTDFYGVLLKALYPKLKLISTMHGWIERTRKSVFYNKLDMLLLKWFYTVIVVSKNMKRTAKRSGIKRIRLIYNAIDIDEWQPKYSYDLPLFRLRDPRSFLVGYVGRISREKGPLDFVKVAHRVIQKDNLFEFVVAGEGPQLEGMQTLTRNLGIMQKFHFLGYVQSSDIYSVYQELDLLVSTSLTEGFPNNILEANAMFVPVVATKVGGVGELIEDGYNGFLSEAGDIHSLVQQTLTLKQNQELAEKFRRNGREVVKRKFSPSESVHQLEEIYEELFRGVRK